MQQWHLRRVVALTVGALALMMSSNLALPGYRGSIAASEENADIVRDLHYNRQDTLPSDNFSGVARLADRLEPDRVASDLSQTHAEVSKSPGTKFRECRGCPEMIVVPAGTFIMGSPSSEEGRFDNEGPQHPVTIARNFAAGIYHVTRGEYGMFIRETGWPDNGGCSVLTGTEWRPDAMKNWRTPGFRQTNRDPVVCVNWDDAQAYVKWLNKRVRRHGHVASQPDEPGSYRLLTEAEWEYSARGGTTTAFYWGHANYHDHANAGFDMHPHKPWADGTDHWVNTSPVGSFAANGFGLHDMSGNVWQWLEDCYHENYLGAPTDGSAWVTDECKLRITRGGAWIDSPKYLRTAYRGKNMGMRYGSLGFRVARTLD